MEAILEVILQSIFEILVYFGFEKVEHKKNKLIRAKIIRELVNQNHNKYIFRIKDYSMISNDDLNIEIITDNNFIFLLLYSNSRKKNEYLRLLIVTHLEVEKPYKDYKANLVKEGHFKILKSIKGCVDVFFDNNFSLRFIDLTNDDILVLKKIFDDQNSKTN